MPEKWLRVIELSCLTEIESPASMNRSNAGAQHAVPLPIAKHHTFLWLAVAILLAGFAVRILLYDYHGLEGDDAYSLSLSRLPVDRLVPGLMAFELDIHPPLHFLLVKGWTGLAGESLLSLRLLNYWMDIGIGALLLRLAGRTLSRPAALVAGVLWAVAPLLFASDLLVRMYTLLALLGMIGFVCIVEADCARGRQRCLLYVLVGLTALAAMYIHMLGFVLTGVFAVGVLASLLVNQKGTGRGGIGARQAVPLPIPNSVGISVGAGLRPAPTESNEASISQSSWRRRFQSALFAFACLTAAALLSLPYAGSLWALYRSGRPLGAEINPLAAFSAADVPDVILSALLTGRSWVVVPFLLTVLIFICIVLVCLRCRSKVLPLAVMTMTGIAAMIGLAWIADLYKPRYLTPFVAPLLALLAGAVLLPKRILWRAGLLLVLAFASGAGLLGDFDRTLRDDWVAAAQFIQSHEQPGDVVIVIPDWGGEAFRYHYGGSAPVMSLLPGVSAQVDLNALLSPFVVGRGRAWYVCYQPLVSDPQALADNWFRAHAVTMTEVFPSGIQVRLYDFDPILEGLPQSARPLDAVFGGTLALRGVEMPVTRGSAHDTRLHPPSAWVQVILYWESLESGIQVVARVRLTDSTGQVYGGAVQRDNDLLVRFPLSSWLPGQIVRAAYDLNLNPDMPSGIYNIEVMVLDEAGQPLPAAGADSGAQWVIAGQYEVE
jgi:hypothetical protein